MELAMLVKKIVRKNLAREKIIFLQQDYSSIAHI